MKKSYGIVVIGGGPAGLAAAIKAYDSGEKNVLIIERDDKLGGILNQCIHNGFGLTRFKESLTGPEYAYRFIIEAKKRDIEIMTGTTVLSLSANNENNEANEITAINPKDGVFTVSAKAVILAMGCRERSRGALNIPGSRPAGIFSAGAAQKFVNIKGYLPGKKVVILGSGDIGLIMARRMTLEGAKVQAVCEIMPYSSGLTRNIVQCLDDFGIPLYLSHTITKIEGKDRVAGVVVSAVDKDKKPIPGTEIRFDCDTVLFSVGLIPENELSKEAGIELSPRTKGAVVDQTRETSVSGIFACGNVLQVHDLVDFVSEEAEIAGQAAAEYSKNGSSEKRFVLTREGAEVSYVLPQKIDLNKAEDVAIYFRVRSTVAKAAVIMKSGEQVIAEFKKPIVVPGEMQRVKLSASLFGDISGDITVEVKKQ